MFRIIAAVALSVQPAIAGDATSGLPELRDYVLGIAACETAMDDEHFYEWEQHRDFFISAVDALTQQPTRGHRAYMDAKRYMDSAPLSADERKADPDRCQRRLSHLQIALIAAMSEQRAGIRNPSSP